MAPSTQRIEYTKDNVNTKIPAINYGEGETATTFQGKCNAFLSTLFPSPPQPITRETAHTNTQLPQSPHPQRLTRLASEGGTLGNIEWPKLKLSEIQQAICTSNPRKASGPDRISFLILQQAIKAIPQLFEAAYSPNNGTVTPS